MILSSWHTFYEERDFESSVSIVSEFCNSEPDCSGINKCSEDKFIVQENFKLFQSPINRSLEKQQMLCFIPEDEHDLTWTSMCVITITEMFESYSFKSLPASYKR